MRRAIRREAQTTMNVAELDGDLYMGSLCVHTSRTPGNEASTIPCLRDIWENLYVLQVLLFLVYPLPKSYRTSVAIVHNISDLMEPISTM